MNRELEAPEPPLLQLQPPSSPPFFSINTLCSMVTLGLIVCEACSLHSPLPQTIKSGINTVGCFHRGGAHDASSCGGGVLPKGQRHEHGQRAGTFMQRVL